jgi:hypothetical protein
MALSKERITELREKSRKVQMELNEIVRLYVYGKIDKKEFIERTGHKKFTKSELWIYLLNDAVKQKRDHHAR